MDDLIEALTILRKYGNPDLPTHCEHDILSVSIDPDLVSGEDQAILEDLGFHPGDYENFESYKFGSC